MFWTKSIWPNVIQDIISLAKFMLDKNTLDKPILDKVFFFLTTNRISERLTILLTCLFSCDRPTAHNVPLSFLLVVHSFA